MDTKPNIRSHQEMIYSHSIDKYLHNLHYSILEAVIPQNILSNPLRAAGEHIIPAVNGAVTLSSHVRAAQLRRERNFFRRKRSVSHVLKSAYFWLFVSALSWAQVRIWLERATAPFTYLLSINSLRALFSNWGYTCSRRVGALSNLLIIIVKNCEFSSHIKFDFNFIKFCVLVHSVRLN